MEIRLAKCMLVQVLKRQILSGNMAKVSLSEAKRVTLFNGLFRNGKRTVLGMVIDRYNGLLRYVKNNFFDGPKQVKKLVRLSVD